MAQKDRFLTCMHSLSNPCSKSTTQQRRFSAALASFSRACLGMKWTRNRSRIDPLVNIVPSLSWHLNRWSLFSILYIHSLYTYYAFPIIRSKQIQNRPRFPIKMDLFWPNDRKRIVGLRKWRLWRQKLAVHKPLALVSGRNVPHSASALHKTRAG